MKTIALLLTLSTAAYAQETLEERVARQQAELERVLAEAQQRMAEQQKDMPNFEQQQADLARRIAEQQAQLERALGSQSGGGSSKPFDPSTSIPGLPYPYTLLMTRGTPFKAPVPSEYAQIQAEIAASVKAGDYKTAAEWKAILDTYQKPTWRQAQAENFQATGAKLANAGAGLLAFTGGYLGKEALHSLETGNWDRFHNAVDYMKTPQFWVTTGISAGTMAYASKMITKVPAIANGSGALARTARLGVPMYAGIASLKVMEAAMTGGDVKAAAIDAGITTGSYLAANAIVRGGTRLALNAAVRYGARFLTGFATKGLYAPLLAMGPWGWAAAGVLFVAETAVTMYLGDKIEGFVRGLFNRGGNKDNSAAGSSPSAASQGRDGVAQKVDRLGNLIKE
jgi:hypothetical protein